MVLIRDGGRPVEALLSLARRYGIEVGEDVTAKDLSQAMQERWIRKTEHQYQVPGGPPSPEDMVLLKELNLVDAVPAPSRPYAGALILGATVIAVRKRLAYLVEEHKRDPDASGFRVTIPTVYMLGGARPLDKDKESPTVLSTPAELPFKDESRWTPPAEMPTTEAGMMRLVFEQSDITPCGAGVFIDTPLQPTPDGKTRHPNTTDTVKEFLRTNPKTGTYLAVSSQPFVARQTMNVKQALPEGFMVVGIGYAAAATTPLKTFLDETARLLFEETAQEF